MRCRDRGRDHRGARGARRVAGGERCPRDRRVGTHRHAGRHRPARASASCVDQARRHAARHRRTRTGRPRGAVRRHHDAHRLRLLARGRLGAQAIEARDKDFVGKSPCDWAYHIMLHSEPPPEFSGPARGGDPGRLSDAQDIHHQHPALAHRPHDRLRRHLGGVPGAGEGRRARRHPRRRQRHRHAHVCQTDPRRPGRLRASRRGAQSALGGFELPPRAAARRKRARHRALHDARVGRHRRCGHRRGARARASHLRRDAAPVPALLGDDYKRPNGQIYHTYPSLKSEEDQKALWDGTRMA